MAQFISSCINIEKGRTAGRIEFSMVIQLHRNNHLRPSHVPRLIKPLIPFSVFSCWPTKVLCNSPTTGLSANYDLVEGKFIWLSL